MTPSVLDLSHHNDVISWPEVKSAGIKGVILKCTQGTKYVDPTYAERKMAAQAAGLLVGAYHFATNADPTAQADWFLKHANADASTLLALDWENNPDGPDMSIAQAQQFLSCLQDRTARGKQHIVVYGGNVLKEHIASAEAISFFAEYKLWLCQYGPQAHCPPAWQKYWLWQYSETGKINGMAADGHVDLNAFGGEDLDAEWAPSSLPPVSVSQAAASSQQSISALVDSTLAHVEAHRDLLSSSWTYWSARINIKAAVATSAGTLAFAKQYALIICACAVVAVLALELIQYRQRTKQIARTT
jgi:lysozyme